MLMVVFIGCGKSEVNTEVNTEANKQSENSCVYNDLYWGTDRDDIIAEKGEPDSYYPNYTIQYNEQFINEDCNTCYYFDSDCKLNEIETGKDTTRSYEDIKNTLIEMYGEPLNDGLDEFGYVADWKVNNTYIKLLVDENFGYYTVYYSLNPID